MGGASRPSHSRRSRLRRVGRALLLAAVLGIVFGGGFAFAAAYYRVPDFVELTTSVKSNAAVKAIFENRAVKSVYYYLKPKLGLGWTGAFHRARQTGPDGLTAGQREEIEALLALGYAEGVSPAGSASGTTVWSRDRAFPGLNLSTDGYQAQALLTDMAGNVLHTWQCPFSEAFPVSDSFDGDPGTYNWRRVKLLPDGELLAIFNEHGLVKLDRDSNRIWAYEEHVHHDVEVSDDGDIWVLTNTAEVVPRIDAERPILYDFVVQLGPDGTEKRRISLLEAIERSAYSGLLNSAAGPDGDIMHTNEIEILDGRLAHEIPAFAAGNLLLTVRNMNAIVVLDPDTERVVWALSGLWRRQHDAHVLDEGNLLVFDNLGAGGRSRVIEVDPVTQEIAWSYASEEFHSETCGASQRLPNGNTLITESNFGRAFEVEPDGTIVWEYYVPDRTGRDNEFIAQLFELVRIDPSSVDWLGPAGSDAPGPAEAMAPMSGARRARSPEGHEAYEAEGIGH